MSPAAVAEYYMETLGHEEQEVLVLTMLKQQGEADKGYYHFEGDR